MKPVEIDTFNTGASGNPDSITIAAKSGYEVVAYRLELDENNTSGWDVTGSGNVAGLNPPGETIEDFEVVVKKVCPPTPTPTPTPSPEPSPEVSPEVSPSPEAEEPQDQGPGGDCCPGPDPVQPTVKPEVTAVTKKQQVPVVPVATSAPVLKSFPQTGYSWFGF